MLTPEEFYDALADQYDGMTQFSARLQRQQEILASLLESLPAKTAVDMGCGTGVHAIALARLGLDVTGVDLSEGMLSRARAHAEETDSAVRFIAGDFLAPVPSTPAELLLCLGNSLPHLESREALTAVLKHWRKLTAPGGHVLIQLLNYRRVLAKRERIVNIRRSGSDTIIRFYDFLDDTLQFNILTIREAGGAMTHSIQSTRLLPFRDSDFLSAAPAAGFSTVRTHGSLALDPFTDDSTDLVVVLH